MSWEGEPHFRWTKMLKGDRYKVTCAELGVARINWTKDGSYQEANEWWLSQRARIDKERVAAHPHADTLADLQRRIEYADRQGLQAEVAAIDLQKQDLQVLPADQLPDLDPDTARRLDAARLLGITIPPDLDPSALAMLFGDSRIWADRFKTEKAVPTDKTVKTHAALWMANQASRVAAGMMSADRCSNNRACLMRFIVKVGPGADVATIDAATMTTFFNHCLGQMAKRKADPKTGWSIAYARDVFSVAKSFVRWLWESGSIELPKNIGSKSFKFGGAGKAVTTWTAKEYTDTVAEAPGKLKLALLLMANCGMTQGDVSDLLDSEVDWVNGTIFRKRSKTKNVANVPTVQYKLWATTFALLKKYRSGTPRVLLTDSGKAYVRKELHPDGKLKKADGFASSFIHLKNRLGLSFTA
jgi:integrase